MAMAVFRAEHTENFTVLSNRYLRDKSISLKAKGLLSQMLSLPDDWDYTLSGLAAINREQTDAVRAALRELERAGYVERAQTRGGGGRMGGAVYNVYEEPRGRTSPPPGKPLSGEPAPGKPAAENPMLEKPPRLKKDRLKKEPQKTDLTNPSTDGAGRDALALKEEILESVDYDWLVERHPGDRELIDEMIGLVWQTRCAKRPKLHAAGEEIPAALVHERMAALGPMHLEFVMDRLKCNATDIRDIRAYLLAALFYAPVTMESYYTAQVARDARMDAARRAPDG